MSYSSNITYEKIKKCAKEEFLKKGYQNANLRDIAKNAGVTTGALYRHFKNKDALFYELVKYVSENLIQLLRSMEETDDIYKRMKDNTIEKGFERYTFLLDFIYENMDEFRLLLLCAKGSKADGFMEQLIHEYTEANLQFIKKAYEAKIAKNMPNKLAVHFLTSGFLTALFEVVVHDSNRKEANEYFETIGLFQYYGWNGLLGIEI